MRVLAFAFSGRSVDIYMSIYYCSTNTALVLLYLVVGVATYVSPFSLTIDFFFFILTLALYIFIQNIHESPW